MRSLAAAGVTVLVSSHILGEIQLICDHVTIISRGRRVAAGRVDEVLAGYDRHEFLVRVAEPERAAELLHAAELTAVVDGEALVVGGVRGPDGHQPGARRAGAVGGRADAAAARSGECLPGVDRRR